MTKDVKEIREKLVAILSEHQKVLRVVADKYEKYEVSGTIEAQQGAKVVDGIYFSSVIPKPKDVRFYFYPAYTHTDQLGELPAALNKALKGKSCFHVKYMDDELEGQLREMVNKAVKLYQEDGLLDG